MSINNQSIWTFGDSKKDRKGRTIYFIGYSNETDSNGYSIELWEPEIEYLKRDSKE